MAFLRIHLIIWGLRLVTTEAGNCDSDWFGSDCQYKCRCTDNKCDDNGICKDGSKCSTGWFGPACQYADLAADTQIKRSGSSVQNDKLTDGDEKTCVDASSFKSFTMDWTTPYPFTWMRIDLERSDQNNEFEIQFKSKNHTDIITNCSNQKMFVVSPTTIDIHCDLDVAVDQVIVSWKNVKSICSIYISGGRNVALKQNTSQSSTYKPTYPSGAAVNDELIWSEDNPSCASTRWESSPHWHLYFTQPKVVNRYVLYSRNQDFKCPIGQYGLECNKTCNCAKNEDCFFGTGGCPSGCAAGFYGNECREECPVRFYGIDCLESCNYTCRNQSCDRVSGKCKGFVSGKEEDFPTEEDSTDGSLEVKIAIGVACTISIGAILAVVLGIVLYRKNKICKSKTKGDARPQTYEDVVVSGGQEENPYEDLYQDANGYSIPRDHHSSDLNETVVYEDIAIDQHDSVQE